MERACEWYFGSIRWTAAAAATTTTNNKQQQNSPAQKQWSRPLLDVLPPWDWEYQSSCADDSVYFLLSCPWWYKRHRHMHIGRRQKKEQSIYIYIYAHDGMLKKAPPFSSGARPSDRIIEIIDPSIPSPSIVISFSIVGLISTSSRSDFDGAWRRRPPARTSGRFSVSTPAVIIL